MLNKFHVWNMNTIFINAKRAKTTHIIYEMYWTSLSLSLSLTSCTHSRKLYTHKLFQVFCRLISSSIRYSYMGKLFKWWIFFPVLFQTTEELERCVSKFRVWVLSEYDVCVLKCLKSIYILILCGVWFCNSLFFHIFFVFILSFIHFNICRYYMRLKSTIWNIMHTHLDTRVAYFCEPKNTTKILQKKKLSRFLFGWFHFFSSFILKITLIVFTSIALLCIA